MSPERVGYVDSSDTSCIEVYYLIGEITAAVEEPLVDVLIEPT